ncbi:MAG: sugar phosphorylase, partial [Spirochaetia bacterium]|nr:sugar phosphorylase [Spirochaetia bacterium]
GDQFRSKGKAPLKQLKKFIGRNIGDAVSAVHILPFSPYSSDDGFSVIDYRKVNPGWGSWDDVEEIGKTHKLMADLVINHCSAQSMWFRKYLEWDPFYRDFFITVKPGTDVSMVFRPRALPLLTPFSTTDGEKLVWTTFSADQVDLNYANPEVLKEMLSIFFMYISKGVQIIRLDAIAFLWKEVGHSCLHHEKTHAVVKVFREAARLFAPWVVIITETNVPHKENLSYFSNGHDEAHMVYQFALPPLTFDAFLREDAGHLRKWASESLAKPSKEVTFFNFLASHDGIGVLPAKGILNPDQIENMLAAVTEKGGFVSYKAVKDGKIPYELNINYRSAIAGEVLSDNTDAAALSDTDKINTSKAIDKFIASQAIMLAMEGVPGIYIHSIIGSLNYRKGVEITGMNRTINREKLDLESIEKELADKCSDRSIILKKYKQLLYARKNEKAFHPRGTQKVLSGDGALFAFLRIPPAESNPEKEQGAGAGDGAVLCIFNISGKILKSFPGWDIFDDNCPFNFTDIITGEKSKVLRLYRGASMVTLHPWEFVWLKM